MRSSGKSSRWISSDIVAEILVSEGEVADEHVREVLEIQENNERGLGEILIALGYTTREKLAQTMSRRLNVTYVVLSPEDVDPELIGMAGADVLEQGEAVPLRIEKGKLVVAMKNPWDSDSRSCVVQSVGRPIIPVAAAEDAIRAARKRLLENWTPGDRAPEKAAR